jgi:hypothetical protein
MKITKQSGEQVTYNAKKLRKSLMKSGASLKVVKEIMQKIEATLYPGIPTKEIYKKAFTLLRKEHKATAAKYKLRNAILELGPSGFPFERYVAHLMQVEGYQTEVGIVVHGSCVDHEIDVICTNDKEVIFLECKFHNNSTFTCNVKTPLYIFARYLDIEKHRRTDNPDPNKNFQFGIVTNTKFSSEAIAYANCVGIQLLAWDYPSKNGIRERIDKAHLHPITCLTTMTKKEKHSLLDNGIILCSDIMNDGNPLKAIGINPGRLPKIMGEARALYELK